MLFQGLEHSPIRVIELSAIRFAEGFVVSTPPLRFLGFAACKGVKRNDVKKTTVMALRSLSDEVKPSSLLSLKDLKIAGRLLNSNRAMTVCFLRDSASSRRCS